MATFHRGTCKRCREGMKQDARSGDQLLVQTPKFSAKNLMHFLDGMDDENAAPGTLPMDPLIGEAENRLRKEYLYLFENATVVESMLISPSHMQVSVCHLRRRKLQRSGVAGFHRNVICFPQMVDELEALNAFWQDLSVNDTANAEQHNGPLLRARVEAIRHDCLDVEFTDGGNVETISPSDIRQRVVLPWQPKDLHNHLIVFRRTTCACAAIL